MKINRLKFLNAEGVKNGHKMASWFCDCGTVVVRRISAVVSGNTKSCGCLSDETRAATGKATRRHGGTKTCEYYTYNHMKSRCYRKENPKYKNYGMRGIRVCSRWLGRNGFANFLLDMGKKPSPKHTIERVDNDGNYCPENCVWIIAELQAKNKTTTLRLSVCGKRMNQAELASVVGVSPHAIEYHRLLGKTADQIYQHFANKNYANRI